MTKQLRLEISYDYDDRTLIVEPNGQFIVLKLEDADSRNTRRPYMNFWLTKKKAQLLAHTLLQMTGEDTRVNLEIPATYSDEAMIEQIYGEDADALGI